MSVLIVALSERGKMVAESDAESLTEMELVNELESVRDSVPDARTLPVNVLEPVPLTV